MSNNVYQTYSLSLSLIIIFLVLFKMTNYFDICWYNIEMTEKSLQLSIYLFIVLVVLICYQGLLLSKGK